MYSESQHSKKTSALYFLVGVSATSMKTERLLRTPKPWNHITNAEPIATLKATKKFPAAWFQSPLILWSLSSPPHIYWWPTMPCQTSLWFGSWRDYFDMRRSKIQDSYMYGVQDEVITIYVSHRENKQQTAMFCDCHTPLIVTRKATSRKTGSHTISAGRRHKTTDTVIRHQSYQYRRGWKSVPQPRLFAKTNTTSPHMR